MWYKITRNYRNVTHTSNSTPVCINNLFTMGAIAPLAIYEVCL